jgi:hypothetical protein
MAWQRVPVTYRPPLARLDTARRFRGGHYTQEGVQNALHIQLSAFLCPALLRGSELLLEVLSPGLVGGLLLPILGAVPDAAVIIASGLGASKVGPGRNCSKCPSTSPSFLAGII